MRVPRRHEHLDGLAVLRIDPRVRDQPRQQVDAVDGRVAGEGLGQLDDVLDLAVFSPTRGKTERVRVSSLVRRKKSSEEKKKESLTPPCPGRGRAPSARP